MDLMPEAREGFLSRSERTQRRQHCSMRRLKLRGDRRVLVVQ
jgi:hypothetical protein